MMQGIAYSVMPESVEGVRQEMVHDEVLRGTVKSMLESINKGTNKKLSNIDNRLRRQGQFNVIKKWN